MRRTPLVPVYIYVNVPLLYMRRSQGATLWALVCLSTELELHSVLYNRDTCSMYIHRYDIRDGSGGLYVVYARYYFTAT